MPRARIVGIGSPFGDDSLGLRAIDLIEASQLLQGYPPGHIELLRLDRPGPVLITQLQGLELAILIDAMRSGTAPGKVREIAPAEFDAQVKPVSSHAYDLGATLRLGRALGALPRRLHVLGLEMGALPHADPAQAADVPESAWAPALMDHIAQLLRGLTPRQS